MWNEHYDTIDTKSLRFTMLCKKKGVIVHYSSFDTSILDDNNYSNIEENDKEEEDSVVDPHSQFKFPNKLCQKLDQNAKLINNHYNSEDEKLLQDKSIIDLFNLIDPGIFNFIVLLTMNSKEKKKIQSCPKFTSYLTGKQYILNIYNPLKKRSHIIFVRRITLAIELIFTRVRGVLVNPLSFAITEMISKYSGKIFFLSNSNVNF